MKTSNTPRTDTLVEHLNVEPWLSIETKCRSLHEFAKTLERENLCLKKKLKYSDDLYENKPITTMNKNKTKMKPETDDQPKTCSVFLVLSLTDYDGDKVEGVFWDREKAKSFRDKLNSRKMRFQQYRAEEWLDGGKVGDEI